MNIQTQTVSPKITGGGIFKTQVLPGVIDGLVIDFVSAKGHCLLSEPPLPGYYIVLLSLKGSALFDVRNKEYPLKGKFIARIPYNEPYNIRIGHGEELDYLCFRKLQDSADLRLISENHEEHSSIYIKALSDCPGYTEDIKSSKTINRMILPEGMVPRFCMGSVETTGPDSVAEHDHPMLDQLFFGLEGCRCTINADDQEAVLTEDMMMHIPLGSKHSVSVSDGDTLAYIWMDFFFTLEGQKYMNEQHKMEGEEDLKAD